MSAFVRHAEATLRKGGASAAGGEFVSGIDNEARTPLELQSSGDACVGETWALVLAGGMGSRLRSLTTTPTGVVVPKQFCSLRRGPSLLTQSLIRAGSMAPVARTCAVVAAQHRWWWEAPLGSLPRENVFVQPKDRGTAHGLLLGLLHLEARDPLATVLMLPADHFIRHEALLARSLTQVVDLAAHRDDAVYLLGAEPDRADTELGYIVPASRKPNGATSVVSFVERPDAGRASRLRKLGALWNMFIVAGSVHALLGLYDSEHGSSVDIMRAAVNRGLNHPIDQSALAAAYQTLRTVDFSGDVLESQASKLQVLRVPPCGWNDLGTPKRVIETLLDLPTDSKHAADAHPGYAALSLADQYGRLSRGGSTP